MINTGLSGAQLARGKLTVNVLVRTLDGRYIGETIYTYNASLMTQFEQCVKALDDDHMEVDIHSSKEGDASLNYRSKPSYTSISLVLIIIIIAIIMLGTARILRKVLSV